jgi:hypothetical protein
MIAKSAITHSGRFSATRATRSPGAIPSAMSPRVRRFTCRAVSLHDSGRYCRFAFAHRNGRSPRRAAVAKNIAGRLRQLS